MGLDRCHEVGLDADHDMKSLLAKIFLLAALAFFAGCGKSPVASQDPAGNEVLAVLRAQTDALNRKDSAAYLATIDSDSPAYGPTKEAIEKLFQLYDLRYTLKDARVESISGDEAHVHFDQTTEKISGPEFRNNHLEGTHVFKKHDGAWKIVSTQVAKLEYLDR